MAARSRVSRRSSSRWCSPSPRRGTSAAPPRSLVLSTRSPAPPPYGLCFLPPGVPPPDASMEPSGPAPPSKKGQFLLLLSDSRRPVLVAEGLMSLWLDRETGAKCYMLSARKLHISWGDTPRYWRWIHLPGSRFEAAELVSVWWFEIRGKIHSKMLSQGSSYAVYIVFKTTDRSSGLDYPPLKASIISAAGMKSSRKIYLRSYEQYGGRHGSVRRRMPVLHRERADGWKELEIGAFDNKDVDDGEVRISLIKTKGTVNKGLIVQGIEIRPRKQG